MPKLAGYVVIYIRIIRIKGTCWMSYIAVPQNGASRPPLFISNSSPSRRSARWVFVDSLHGELSMLLLHRQDFDIFWPFLANSWLLLMLGINFLILILSNNIRSSSESSTFKGLLPSYGDANFFIVEWSTRIFLLGDWRGTALSP